MKNHEEQEHTFEEEGTQAGREVTEWGADFLEEDKVPTGVRGIDEEIGGLPSGSVVALLVDPRGIGDLLCYHLAASAPTKYITTARPKKAIKRDFNTFGPAKQVPDYTSIEELSGKSSQQDLETLVRRQDGTKNFIIDTVTSLATTDQVSSFVRNLYTSTSEREGLTYLLFTNTHDELSQDIENALHLCDVVMSVGYDTRANGTINHDLEITRIRGSRETPDERFRLDPADSITLDTTRTTS